MFTVLETDGKSGEYGSSETMKIIRKYLEGVISPEVNISDIGNSYYN